MTLPLTKNINIVQCLANNISIPVILDSEIVQQRNFSPAWYHCNDAAVISCSKEVIENNISYILFYKEV